MEFKRLQRLRQIQAQLKQQQLQHEQQQLQQEQQQLQQEQQQLQQQEQQEQQEQKTDSDSGSSSDGSGSSSGSISSSSSADISAKFQKLPRDRSKHQLNKLLRLSPVKTGRSYSNSTLNTTSTLFQPRPPSTHPHTHPQSLNNPHTQFSNVLQYGNTSTCARVPCVTTPDLWTLLADATPA